MLSKVLRANLNEEKFFVPLDGSPRLRKTTVVALAVNVHANGNLLDIAWVEAPLKSIFEDITGQETSKCHITIQKNLYMKMPGFRRVVRSPFPSLILALRS